MWGSLAWLSSFFVKIVVDTLVGPFIYTSFPLEFIIIYIGVLTGIFEIFIPLFIISKKTELFKNFNDRIGFGISFGACEAIFLGFFVFLNFFLASAVVGSGSVVLPDEVIAAFSLPNETYLTSAFLAGVERISALVLHVFATLLIFAYFFSGRLEYLISGILYKTFVDATAGFFVLSQTFTGEAIEIFYFGLAMISLVILWKFKPLLNIQAPVPIEERPKKAKKRKKKTK